MAYRCHGGTGDPPRAVCIAGLAHGGSLPALRVARSVPAVSASAIRLTHRPRSLPLTEPFRIARGVEEAYETVEVSLHWEGFVGAGEATPVEHYGETVESATGFLDGCAGVLGTDPFAFDAIGSAMAEAPGEMAAKAAIDAALHDLCGQITGQPLWRLLGVSRVSPPTTITVGLDDPDAMARRATKVADGRYRLLKLKLGGRDGLDVDRVGAVRAVTELPIMVDVNEYWSLGEALEAIPRLRELGVAYVEQPLRAGDPDGPTLKERAALPIYVDEDCHTLADVTMCAERAHGINIKLAKSGGIREAIRMVHAARALGLGVMIGCMGESSLGLAPACPVASLCDHVDLDGNELLVDDPWQGVNLIDGVQVPSERPGLGVWRRG